jgi:hypothetical protein
MRITAPMATVVAFGGRGADEGCQRNPVEAKKTFQMRKKSGENPLTEIGLTSILGQ